MRSPRADRNARPIGATAIGRPTFTSTANAPSRRRHVVLALGIGFKKTKFRQRNARDRRLVALCHGDGLQINSRAPAAGPPTPVISGPKCFVYREIHFDRGLTPP